MPSEPREYISECSHTSSSTSAFVASSRASQAARMSANSVLPPAGLTTRADSSEYFAGITRNELSECQSRLPRLNRCTRESRSRGRPSRPRLETSFMPTANRRSSGFVMLPPRASSRRPKLRLNAICCSSVIFWSRNTSTAQRSIPASMAATSSGEGGLLMSRPDTSPTNTGWIWRMEILMWSVPHDPSVHVEGLPGDVPGLVGGEKGGHARDVVGRVRPAEGDRGVHPGQRLGLGDLLALGHALDDPLVHRGARHAGADGIDVDVESGELGGGDPRHGNHRALGAGVGDVGGVPEPLARDGRDVDDLAGATLRHLPRRRLHAEEDALGVDRVDPVPIGLAHLEEIELAGDAGVVHQNVEPSEALDRSGHERVDVLQV